MAIPRPNLATVALMVAVGGMGAVGRSEANGPVRLESGHLRVEIDSKTGRWRLVDTASGVRWPSEGAAKPGVSEGLPDEFSRFRASANRVQLMGADGGTVAFELADGGRSVMLRYEGKAVGDVRVLDDALAVTDAENGYVVVPCREGLLVPADSGVAFRRVFGTSDYEGCHMNMLGFQKNGATLLVTWDDAYVFPRLESRLLPGPGPRQRITTSLLLRRSARAVRLTPLGKGDWNAIAAGYRRLAEQKGLAVTLKRKIERNEHAGLLLGAANVKLWTCLARRMNEESTKEEWVRVRWTFEEAAAIAEHLRRDLDMRRCLFIMGGWTEGGYDCRHPDNLPANAECGGNEALAKAIRRIQGLGFVACLHDNYQDMYRDAKSWDPAVIEKRPDGSLVKGGRWLGGRAYMVCAPKQFELAMRPQNLPAIHRLFGPWCYFIDTTYAVGPRECADPHHPIDRNDDIVWKTRLSDAARELFGLFGSECGREWAVPHSDFFEGLVGVAGRYFHSLKPAALGATVIPFWEMVYHDCQFCYGKYGYRADRAAEYVAHHVLCARPLHYHSIPDHLYWKGGSEQAGGGRPGGGGGTTGQQPSWSSPSAAFTRTDHGWAAGRHPVDAFMKNTHEVLGPLHAATAFERLTRLEFLTPDRAVRRATYGGGSDATVVVVNFGRTDASIRSPRGGTVLLPPWGFVIEGPRLTAFYAKSWNGLNYPHGALFTVQPVGDTAQEKATRLRIFHGFGNPRIRIAGKEYQVEREQVVPVTQSQP